MAPTTGVTFNPDKKKRKQKQRVVPEHDDMRDAQDIADLLSSDDEPSETVAAPPLPPPASSPSLSGARKRRRKIVPEPEIDDVDDDVEEVIDLSSRAVASSAPPRKMLKLIISENACLLNHNPRFPQAKHHAFARIGKDGNMDYNFGIPNRDMPAMLSCALICFNKDPGLIQHLKSEPRLIQSIKESFKDLMANLKQ